MIYEETYQYLLRNVSSTEFDTCLYALLHSDWDGVIQSPLHMMARGVGTTEKYLRQIINKFTAPQGSLKKVFVPVHQGEDILYKFNLGPASNLGYNRKTDRYCKKYRFLYCDAFKTLTIHGKRLLLMGAFRMSVLKSEEVLFDYSEIVPDSSSLFTKQRLLDAIDAIHDALGNIVTISLASRAFSKKEVLVFTFTEGVLEQYKENRAERALLRRTIFNSGYLGHINDSVCRELERAGKYIFRSFLQETKNISNDIQKELQKLARFVYSHSLKKFGQAIPANEQLLLAPKQASAYLSKIMYNETLEQMVKYAHQAESIKSLLERVHFHRNISEKALCREVNDLEMAEHIKPILQKYHQADFIRHVLNDWCETWLISRVKTVTEEFRAEGKGKSTDADKQVAAEYMARIRNDTYDQLDRLLTLLLKFGNHAVAPAVRNFPLTKKKETLQSYFAIQKERLDVLSISS
ncbi:hypothetical protein J7J00_01070 [Bacillus sp. ISL-4]|uniref:hypothetical protein n=1 Tax=Bacillus sp. ISL-4 TaxID=2819125 RepID=UPI001BED27F1|nr:hypothetical protein [Bacillus sp. ISL-4]MBT2664100.1 hypothetical protein [Bacillus sp. ISL-4]MBT2671734.1 hypothetical protein [Streptomyces sp. ISL-14]